MDSFVKAAILALKQARRPLTAHEIVNFSVSEGFLTTSGKTPHKTMNARLSEHILECGLDSLVMRSNSGEFALREWSNKIPEYVAPRRHFNPFEEDILVFSREYLNQVISSNGLNKVNYSALKKLIEISHSMQRGKAEETLDFVQLVSSFLITYRGKVLTYKRSKRLPEKRMHDAYCLNFGGHISFEDRMPLFGLSSKEFVDLAMRRELDEEVRFDPPPKKIHLKGLIYDPSTEMGQQHIGIVFHVPIPHTNYVIGEKGFLLGDSFETKRDILNKLDSFDTWSQMIFKGYVDGW